MHRARCSRASRNQVDPALLLEQQQHSPGTGSCLLSYRGCGVDDRGKECGSRQLQAWKNVPAAAHSEACWQLAKPLSLMDMNPWKPAGSTVLPTSPRQIPCGLPLLSAATNPHRWRHSSGIREQHVDKCLRSSSTSTPVRPNSLACRPPKCH